MTLKWRGAAADHIRKLHFTVNALRRVLQVMIDEMGLWEDGLHAICRIWIWVRRILYGNAVRGGLQCR